MSGAATNPSLDAKTGGKLAAFEGYIFKIRQVCDGPSVLVEPTAETTETMVKDAEHLAELAPNIVVELPTPRSHSWRSAIS